MDTTAQYRTLLSGEMLNWYRIERILGRGGFGVIYLATDTNLDHPVAIKEYRALAPEGGTGISGFDGQDTDLAYRGMRRFIAEARNLVRFNHPNIVRVMSVFELNDTAYIVMEFEEGRDLCEHLKMPQARTEAALKALFLPITEGLSQVHQLGFAHRDIKPANILVRTDGSPVLLDFGSARPATRMRNDTLTALVSAGYAPLEQYSSGSEHQQGPWTDIYALGAVLYFAITGNEPVDSAKRGTAILNGGHDPLIPARMMGRERYSASFLGAIDWALEFRIDDRPQNLREWVPVLLTATARPSNTHRTDTILNTQPTSRDVFLPDLDSQADDLLSDLSFTDHNTHRKLTSFTGQNGHRELKPVRVRGSNQSRLVKSVLVLISVAVLTGVGWVLRGVLSTDNKSERTALVAQQFDRSNVTIPTSDTTERDLIAEQAIEKAKADAAAEEKARDLAAQEEQRRRAEAARITAANEQSRLAAARKAEQQTRLRQQRQRLDQQLELASSLIDRGLLDEAETTLDDAALLDRTDSRIQQLRRRWRAALINSRTPVSDREFDRVVARFDALRRALESNDVEAMDNLTTNSDQNALFRQLMSSFKTLDIKIHRIQVWNVNKSITAILRIQNMVRANGDRATPSTAYRERIINSRRVEGDWTAIEW